MICRCTFQSHQSSDAVFLWQCMASPSTMFPLTAFQGLWVPKISLSSMGQSDSMGLACGSSSYNTLSHSVIFYKAFGKGMCLLFCTCSRRQCGTIRILVIKTSFSIYIGHMQMRATTQSLRTCQAGLKVLSHLVGEPMCGNLRVKDNI